MGRRVQYKDDYHRKKRESMRRLYLMRKIAGMAKASSTHPSLSLKEQKNHEK